MNIQEIVEKMDSFTEDERVKYLGPVLNKMSMPSQGTLRQFQNQWREEIAAKEMDADTEFREFVKAQNVIIKECIKMEDSDLGKIVRETQGLPVWNMQEEIA
jgi:uncharacterized protein YfaP (DUF2135 family)